jgi:uncharacterized protein (TIGR02996 family)
VTSFIVHSTIERDPRDRAVAPVIAAPLVTTTLTIQHRRLRNQPSRIERVAFAGAGTIGRESDIRIDDGFLGARHAELVPAADGLRIRDLDTTNGTFVNGCRVRDEVLRAGDILLLGQQRLWFSHTLASGARFPERAVPLLLEIIAAPDDDAPRMVLADLLGELGDPRGEFIACQISGAHERADELLASHATAWAGPFTHPVHHWTFRRGFIDAIYVDDLDVAAPVLDDHPLAELRLVSALADAS